MVMGTTAGARPRNLFGIRVRKGGFFQRKVAELGLDMERESGVCVGERELSCENKRGVVWGTKEAETGLEGEREGRGCGGGGGVREFDRRAIREAG